MLRPLTSCFAGLIFCAQSFTSEIQPVQDSLIVDLSPKVQLTFALHEDRLLGLAQASVDGVETTSRETIFRPYLTEDMFGTPHLTHALRFVSAERQDKTVTLILEVLATSERAALDRFYVMTPDLDKIASDPQLQDLRHAAEQARADIRTHAIAKHPGAQKAEARLQEHLANGKPTKQDELQVYTVRTSYFSERLDKQIQKAIRKTLKDDDVIRAAQAHITAYEQARQATAIAQSQSRIHTDYFGQAIPQLPAESALQANQIALSQIPGKVVGTLRWTFTHEQVNIGGWDWQGWSHQVHYTGLDGSPAFRVLRNQGTWELGGEAVGSTIVAMRYRGLGSIEETFEDDGTGGVHTTFSTTEIIPGAVGGAPVISPAIPQSVEVGDRGYGLQHRLSPWIGVMARGGGANVVDFQYRPQAIYASYPIRQGNLRACTEAFPGDRHISQRDEEWFAAGTSFSSTPFMHLVLSAPQDQTFSRWQSITRWQEVDQFVRDLMSEELNLIQPEPLPAAGYNTDYAWEKRIGALSGQIEDILGPQGVRMILQHQPGWINGRDLNRKKDSRHAGGGDCTPYDFTAEGETAEAWKRVSAACAKWDIDYYAWLSTIAHKAGQFALEVDALQGGLQASWGEIGDGKWTRSRDLYAFDPINPHFSTLFDQRMAKAREELGYQGIWIDSWQKWTTSFSTHGAGRPPLARDFWELFAKWSHEGVALMSESTAFPGLSCSVELPNNNFEDEWWFMQHTVKWFRAHDRPPGFETAAATDFAFRMYANKATFCWNTEGETDLNKGVPGWSRLAHEYLAALPMMRRSWILSEGAGVLWLGYDNDQKGVWFPFSDSALPTGVQAKGIISQKSAVNAAKHHVLVVEAVDLLEAFGVQRGSLIDPRIGKTYQPFKGSTPIQHFSEVN